MKKLLIVVDMQNDFVTGALGSAHAEAILPQVRAKIAQYKQRGDSILFTRDTHHSDYLSTQEGQLLAVPHCIEGTHGHDIVAGLTVEGCEVCDKPSFGSLALAQRVAAGGFDAIELCGLCTDICVVSNALLLKATLPETPITVDVRCCAGVTEASHNAALLTMKMCQIHLIGENA